MQMGALVGGNAREQDVMMAALDDIDRVDLHVTQVLHRSAWCRRTVAEWRGGLKPLRPQPDASGASLGERIGLASNRAHQRGRMACTGWAELPTPIRDCARWPRISRAVAGGSPPVS